MFVYVYLVRYKVMEYLFCSVVNTYLLLKFFYAAVVLILIKIIIIMIENDIATL